MESQSKSSWMSSAVSMRLTWKCPRGSLCCCWLSWLRWPKGGERHYSNISASTADTRKSVPCPSMFDPQSPVCWTSVNAPYHPQARYNSSTQHRWNCMRTSMQHGQDTANATVPLCNLLAIMAVLRCAAPTMLYDDISNVCGLLRCDDVCKGRNCSWLGPGRCECRPAGL